MKVIVVAGLVRSGHHSFMNWLSSQIPGLVVHLNNVHVEDGDLYVRQFGLSDDNIIIESIPYDVSNTMLIKSKVSGVLINFESRDINEMSSWSASQSKMLAGLGEIDLFWGPIVFNRDIYNWMASYINSPGHENSEIDFHIDLWKQYIDASLDGKVNHVSYNRWIKDVEYRKQISHHFGLNFSDRFLGHVSRYGGGSSFDKYDFQGKAQTMDVLNRWKLMENDHDYWSKIGYDLEERNRKYFGFYIDKLDRTKKETSNG